MLNQFSVAPVMVNGKRRNSRGRARPFVSLSLAPQSGFSGLGDVGVAPQLDRETIRWVQQALNTVMGAGLAEDGVLGPRTQAAVSNFQGLHGLQVWGMPDYDTRMYLSAALTEAQATARYLGQQAIDRGRAVMQQQEEAAEAARRARNAASDLYQQTTDGPGIFDSIYTSIFGSGTQEASGIGDTSTGTGAQNWIGKVALALGLSTAATMAIIAGGGLVVAMSLLGSRK